MQGQYLNEENYNRVNKKIKLISLIILLIGLLSGGVFIAIGMTKSDEAKRAAETTAASAKTRLTEIAAEQSSLETEYNNKQKECNSLDMSAQDWLSAQTECQREASNIDQKLNELETEEFKLKNMNYAQPDTSPLYYIIGAICIGLGFIASLSIFLITKRRALLAYHAQTAMPVGKEAIEQITPTAAKAASDMASSVAEGIAHGVKKGKNS